ncbi:MULTISPECIES: hypothetical protein [Laceyella]|uniref:Uncharacterized protein n=1 Tax=Laceyella sediminis TaxID=573074 RepID=A0ABX5ENH3_9BACL|nr:hypothetical protein [Laceyella sediminis]MRG27201.1 hypothetical protein [Laceyella tengchongensis]PRZ13988.1 hypothetical protein CLV36_107183 [Laceyella sediminis]
MSGQYQVDGKMKWFWSRWPIHQTRPSHGFWRDGEVVILGARRYRIGME